MSSIDTASEASAAKGEIFDFVGRSFSLRFDGPEIYLTKGHLTSDLK